MGKYIYDAIIMPEEEGGYSVEIPALPGCYTCGDNYRDAVFMAADAMKTWIAAALSEKRTLPSYEKAEAPEGCERVSLFVETEETYIVDAPVISAAQAARELGVSAGRITHMIDAGILDGYRNGRSTFVTVESVNARKIADPKPGRPKRTEALEG